MTSEARVLTTLSRAAVALVAIICGTAGIGWVFEVPTLTSIVPGFAPLAQPSILCFLLSGGTIVALTLSLDNIPGARAARIIAPLLVAAVGLYALADFVARGGLVGSTASMMSGNLFGPESGRVAPATAFNFLILAAALLLPPGHREGRIYGALLAVGLAVTALAITGYVYGVEALYRVAPFSAMALPTAACFALLFAAALLARPRDGWIATVLGDDSGGVAARRLLPSVVIVPFLLGGLMVAAGSARVLDAPFGFALLAVATAAGLAAITMVMAGWLAARDAERSESRRLIEAIVEHSPAVIYVKDLAGRYLMVNRRYAEIFHLDRGDVIGKTDHEIFPKAAADAFRAMDERVASADQPLTEEETAPLDDGPHSYISVKSPLRYESGRPYAVFGISTDVTDQRRAEEALRASEQRNRLIVEAALDAVITIDSAGAVTGWSPQAEKTFGWTQDEVLGRPVDEVIMPERYRDAHRQGLARYLATGEARVLNQRIELSALHRNGREFPVELSITPIREGGAVSFSAFVRDITDRKLADLRLQTQLERLHLLEQITRAVAQRQDVQSIYQVVVRTLEDQLPADFACICRYDRVAHMLTVAHVGTSSAALGRELGIVERAEVPIDRNGLSRCVAGELVYEPDIAEVDFPFPRRLAAHGLRSLVVTPLAVEADVFGVLVIARLQPEAFASSDCEFLGQLGEHVALAAHQSRLHDSLQRAYDDLKQTQQGVLEQERLRAIGQMASGIAHDINNAISPVAVYNQALLEEDRDWPADVRDHLELVGRVVRDVSATVARMREFYRDDQEELAAIDLNELVPQVVELTRARWSDMPQQRGTVIRVSTELETDLPLVMGIASELRETLTNLIFNAVDAMPDGGTLTIRTATFETGARRRVRIEVADSGAGMDEETRRRCLEPFFTTKGARGTGLGLAMVHGAAQRHGAHLEIDSVPGEGTRIGLEFAAAARGEAAKRSVAAKREDLPLRLLLVDDDPAVLGSTALVLRGKGHMISTADGGQAGIDALRAAHAAGEPFDVVITDLGMPYVDGNQVARVVKELFPTMPVVLLTGWGRRMTSGDDAPAHVDFVLPKPLELDQLREAFEKIASAASS